MKKISGTICTIVILVVAVLLCAPLPDSYCGEPSWRVEFDDTCANTSGAMAMSMAELQELIAKCERLQKDIENLDESTRKVFLKRLLMCKNLYQYVLDSKKTAPEHGAQ